MLTKSRPELFRSRDRLAGARSPETRRGVRVADVAIPRMHRGGDTDALDWRSDPRLLAILARGVKREQEARENNQFPWLGDELDQPAPRAGARRHSTRFNSAGGVRDVDAVDPLNEFDLLAEQLAAGAQTPRPFPMDAHRRADEFVVCFDPPGTINLTVRS
jgi:hypothetical protein